MLEGVIPSPCTIVSATTWGYCVHIAMITQMAEEKCRQPKVASLVCIHTQVVYTPHGFSPYFVLKATNLFLGANWIYNSNTLVVTWWLEVWVESLWLLNEPMPLLLQLLACPVLPCVHPLALIVVDGLRGRWSASTEEEATIIPQTQ